MKDIVARRDKAVAGFMHQVTAILAIEGVTPSALHGLKLKLAALG
jgi:hypothetical protein